MDWLKDWIPSRRGLMEGIALLVGSWLWDRFRPENAPSISDLLPYVGFAVIGVMLMTLLRFRGETFTGVAIHPAADANLDGGDERIERVEIETYRLKAEAAEESLRNRRAENETLSRKLSTAQANLAQMTTQIQSEITRTANFEKALLTTSDEARRIAAQREAEQPLYEWAAAQVQYARGHIAEQIEIADYQFHMDDLNQKVNAGFAVAVRLRYWGVLVAQIGEMPEYGGRLFFQGRRMGRDPEIGALRLGRGQTGWITIRQTLEGDAAAVREDWESGSIVVDASHLRLSICCDDPGGGEPIVGNLRLEEMTWPKPSK